MYAQDNYFQKIYDVGIYLRLSREDETSGQSESITNQREYIERYILSQNWNMVEVYIDDGFSGLNFERPAFKKLITDIERGLIDLVITKDLSRLGRDYIETGFYLEKYFPQKGVRYIALADGIDTFQNSSNNDMSPFKAIINDMYAKDISKKIRTVVDTKQKNGYFIGAFAPFGYSKDPNQKGHLIVDEEAARIVKRIYDMYLHGFSISKIQKVFNAEKIMTPTQYKNEVQNLSYVNVNSKFGVWRNETIRTILANTTYIGSLAQHKAEKINYKLDKFKKIPRENWIVVENTHEPIIDSETFDTIQNMLAKKANAIYPARVEHMLSGIAFCKDCGMPMTFRRLGVKKEFVLVCSNYSRFGQCTRNIIKEEELNNCIVEQLKKLSKSMLSDVFLESISQEIKKDTSEKTHEDELRKISKRLNDIQKIIKSLYEDKIRGVLSETDFLDLSKEFNDERSLLGLRQESLLKEQQEKSFSPDKAKELIRNIANFDTISRAILCQLIKKVEVSKNKEVLISYTFKEPIEEEMT